MKILDGTKGLDKDSVIALGSFDGIHVGHKALVDLALELGEKNNMKTVIFTFDNHPLSVINRDRMPKLLTSKKVKIDNFSKMGLDYLTLVKFDQEFMKKTPEEFVKLLVEEYSCKHIVVGFNYRFGHKNLGDVELLRKLQTKYGYEVHMVKPVKLNESSVSSTLIRGLVFEGDIARANRFLGHTFVLDGKVIQGKKIGRTIGFPTLNLDYDYKCVVPKGGVYSTLVEYKGEIYKGITNVGYNPTVNGNKLSIETHVLDFDEDIYGEYFKLHFIRKIREEKKFDSIEDLKRQIEKDREIVDKDIVTI